MFCSFVNFGSKGQIVLNALKVRGRKLPQLPPLLKLQAAGSLRAHPWYPATAPNSSPSKHGSTMTVGKLGPGSQAPTTASGHLTNPALPGLPSSPTAGLKAPTLTPLASAATQQSTRPTEKTHDIARGQIKTAFPSESTYLQWRQKSPRTQWPSPASRSTPTASSTQQARTSPRRPSPPPRPRSSSTSHRLSFLCYAAQLSTCSCRSSTA